MSNSKTIYRHYGKVINGKQIYYNPKLKEQVLAELEGQEFEEITKLKHKKVSLDTHGYYRAGIIKECSKHEMFGGWEEDDIHDHFAGMFLKYTKIKVLNGVQIPVIKIMSTANLNQKDMNEYVEKVIAWLALHNIKIQSPDEYYIGRYRTTYDENSK